MERFKQWLIKTGSGESFPMISLDAITPDEAMHYATGLWPSDTLLSVTPILSRPTAKIIKFQGASSNAKFL